MQRPQRQDTPPIGKDTPDSELARRAAAGEELAFAAIMRRHNQRLFRTARSILKSDSEAEDAVQDAYIHAWRALGGFRADAALSTWLVRIVANEALGRLRRKSAPVIPLDATMNNDLPNPLDTLAAEPERQPEQLTSRAQFRTLVEAQIDRLPEVFRSVFVLRAIEEMSVEEVAQALDIPEATVRTRFFRARGLIREGLAGQLDMATADAFAFDGARCDRIVAGVLARGRAEGLARAG